MLWDPIGANGNVNIGLWQVVLSAVQIVNVARWRRFSDILHFRSDLRICSVCQDIFLFCSPESQICTQSGTQTSVTVELQSYQCLFRNLLFLILGTISILSYVPLNSSSCVIFSHLTRSYPVIQLYLFLSRLPMSCQLP